MSGDKYRIIKNAGIAAVVVGICYCTFEYIVPLVVPFAIAYFISRLVRPVSTKTRALCPPLDKPVTVLAIFIITVVIFIVLRLVFSVIFRQFTGFISSLRLNLSSSGDIITQFAERLSAILSKHTVISKLLSDGLKTDGIITEFIRRAITEFAAEVGGAASTIVSYLPSIFLSFFITLSATFYFSLDRGETKKFIYKFISLRNVDLIEKRRKTVSKATAAYFKTYVLIMALVFSVLYAGLSLIGVEYALIKAILISIIDLLPILGVGTVLVPWAIIEVVWGNSYQAVGLVVLFVITTVIREIAEPKIIGDNIGVPPIVALISVYVGMKLFGVTGLIFLPILVSVVFSVVNETRKEKTPAEAEVSIKSKIIPSER